MNIKTLLPLAALALSGLATAAPTHSVVVRYGDLNLDSQAGIARLHKRIANAAESVCDPLETRILSLQAAYKVCVNTAVTDGVAAVDNASLSQYHASKGRFSVVAATR